MTNKNLILSGAILGGFTCLCIVVICCLIVWKKFCDEKKVGGKFDENIS